jgi:hypothetical protein
MDLKSTLRAITLELRHELEGKCDAQGGWQPGDLERRLAAIGVRRDRPPVPVDELPHLPSEDCEARRVVDAFLQSRSNAGESREAAITEFVREAAYTWANRLLALRCMEARGLIDEVILQKDAYGGRSLQHQRLARKEPERCSGEDEGLLAVLFDEFGLRAKELPLLFDPKAPEVSVRPSIAALKRCIALLSGTLAAKGQEAATDEVFTTPDALGWTYQYWNTEEKDRVFEKVRTKKGAKIEGAEIIPATCIYTEPYMVKFLVQNSLGAMWMGMNPSSRLCEGWEYYARNADRASVSKKMVSEITFLDPTCGSGHFLIEAFEVFYALYVEEGTITDPAKICAAILESNLYGIDIDERAVQIAAIALVMKAKEKAPDFVPRHVNLVATNIRLPAGKEHLEAFLRKHPDDALLKPALLAIFEGLAHADELGSLLQIQEPLDRELRHLRSQQLERERKAAAGTLFDPRSEADWTAWKHNVIERLREHFGAEAEEIDLATAFFGEAVSKGLSLVDLLARRYDVVAANPPYMGSKNMGPVLKRYVERFFLAGKRDLYAAFILRCRELTCDGGRVAMVTQQSWMFMPAFASLRAFPEDRAGRIGFAGLIRSTTLEVLAHLGSKGFSEIGGEIVNSALFVSCCTLPATSHRVTSFRLVAAPSASEKEILLRRALASATNGLVFRPVQSRFLAIPGFAVCYWLRDRFIELLASAEKLGDRSTLTDGVSAADKFVRFLWEVPRNDKRWPIYQKGGGYRKWYGFNIFTCDWHADGAKIRQHILERYPAEKFSLKYKPFDRTRAWVTWSDVASGSMGARLASAGDVLGSKGPGVRSDEITNEELLALLNCRAFTYLLRTTSTTLQFSYPGVRDAPALRAPHEDICTLVTYAVAEKRVLVGDDPCEMNFHPWFGVGRWSSIREMYSEWREDRLARTARLLLAEGQIEWLVIERMNLGGAEIEDVLKDTGRPSGWFPCIQGYEALPTMSAGPPAPDELAASIERGPKRAVSTVELHEIKRRLRALYESGTDGGTGEADEADASNDEEEEAETTASTGARIPIPAESLLEELAQHLEVHPISVFWLLREMLEADGLICASELQSFVEDYVSNTVLRLLGHRWPSESGQVLSTWADRDGIVLGEEGTNQSVLVSRVRDRLAENFGTEQVRAVEREFHDIVDKSLSEWLSADFFKRHISQFRKRPIVWRLQSSPGGNAKRQNRRSARKAPAFSCLVYYQRLDADLLPKLRTQYIGPLRTSVQTELAGLEKLNKRTTDQDARRLELEEKFEELKAFDARLEQVIFGGFTSTALDAVAANEPLDKWTRSGAAPTSREAFLAQERKYAPDLNDGIRVNISPLQRAGLLAADVLAAKDVEKAIADRAHWRADERRWCREGKLPGPGWWPEGVAEVKTYAACSKGTMVSTEGRT